VLAQIYRQNPHQSREPRSDALLSSGFNTPRDVPRGDVPVPRSKLVRATRCSARRAHLRLRQPLLRIHSTRKPSHTPYFQQPVRVALGGIPSSLGVTARMELANGDPTKPPGLRSLELQQGYRTHHGTNPITGFFRPCPDVSITYDRAVGYFTSKSLRDLH